jgi:hypothetical protein
MSEIAPAGHAARAVDSGGSLADSRFPSSDNVVDRHPAARPVAARRPRRLIGARPLGTLEVSPTAGGDVVGGRQTARRVGLWPKDILAQWQTGQSLFQLVGDNSEHEQNAGEQGDQLYDL